MDTIISILPISIKQSIARHINSKTEEIRLRVGQVPYVVTQSSEFPVMTCGQSVRSEDLQFVLSAVSSASLYSVNDKLREGFLTLRGGHRLGVCGEIVAESGCIRTVRNISSLSIRIARERQGIGFIPTDSTLILGPPGSGKTTLLRDCIRQLSDMARSRVGIVDERGEIAACRDGVPQFQVGARTDVLSSCEKEQGIMMLLRSMNPHWIAVDEITKSQDVDALRHSAYCGVKLLATTHAYSFEDLHHRPIYRKLLDDGIFPNKVLLRSDHTLVEEEIA